MLRRLTCFMLNIYELKMKTRATTDKNAYIIYTYFILT